MLTYFPCLNLFHRRLQSSGEFDNAVACRRVPIDTVIAPSSRAHASLLASCLGLTSLLNLLAIVHSIDAVDQTLQHVIDTAALAHRPPVRKVHNRWLASIDLRWTCAIAPPDKMASTDAAAAPAAAAAAAATTRTVETVVVHPLVLLSVTDHYYRVARDTQNRRVVGVLLGETYKGRVDVTNSFAVPFEEVGGSLFGAGGQSCLHAGLGL